MCCRHCCIYCLCVVGTYGHCLCVLSAVLCVVSAVLCVVSAVLCVVSDVLCVL